RPSFPEAWAVYHTVPSAATATSWGAEPAGTANSWMRGVAGAPVDVEVLVTEDDGRAVLSRCSPEPQAVERTNATAATATVRLTSRRQDDRAPRARRAGATARGSAGGTWHRGCRGST